MLEPGIRSGELPPFHRIGAYRFDELCRDLLGTEPDIAVCDIYGKPGQTQHGIDLLAHRSNGDGIEVGQCKCYEDFPPRKIRAVSDEFLEHWDIWSKRDVKRFVLFVASDLKTRQRQDEILAQGKRFEQVDIVYEAWSAATILNKLRPRPGIVASHLIPREYWVPVICGTSLPVSGFGGELLDTVHIALKSQIAQLAMRLSDDKGERIEHLREAWREGRREETLRGIASLKEDPVVWPLLHIETQARLLRFEANVVLQTTGDVLRAKELADEAYALVSSDGESSLRALIAYVEFGPEAALPILAEQQDLDNRNLKAAFLLQMSRANEGSALLDFETTGFEPNAETFRLRALLRLGEKEIDLAQLEIQKAAELAPHWESVRYTLAVVNYFSALSPAALPGVLVPWPEPVEWSLVKRDDESLQRLRAAEKTFRDMSKKGTREAEEHRRLQAWRLACLANDPEQQEAAIQHCQIMLIADATDFRALSWVVARNFGLELENSEAALETLVADGSATIPHILALAGCYVTSRKIDLAKRLLGSQRSLFEEAQMLPLWNLWYVQLLIANDETDAASAALDQVPAGEELRLARLATLTAQSRSSGDWQTTFGFLDTSYAETHNPRFLLDGCELAAQIERWEYTADRAEQLVDGLQTEDALRLAAYATYNTQRYEVCLGLLDRYIKLCSRQMLPRDLRRARALCQQALGAFPSAVAELEDLANEASAIENLLALAQLYSEIGDLKRLAVVGRRLSVHPDLGAATALQLAQLIRLEDLTLARVLWFKAARDLPDSLVGQALGLGYKLGLDEETSSAFSSRMLALAQQGQGGIFVKRIEDLAEMFAQLRERHAELEQLYREGKAPIHLIAEQLRLPLVNLYRSQLLENEKTLNLLGSPPLLARHGARPLLRGFPAQAPEWRLHLDTTSLLLAAHLDILDAVERVFAPLRIPAELIGALVSMRDRLRHPQPSRLETYQKIVQLAREGTFQTVNYDGSPFVPDTPDLVEDLGESWQYLFEHARASEGYLVDFLPLNKLGTSQVLPNLPDAVTERVINCRSIVEALHRCGPLASRDYARALEKLGNEGPKPPIWVIPEPGAPLYFYANTPELLVGAELFRDVCARFEVHVEQRELDLALAALEAHQQTQKVDNW